MPLLSQSVPTGNPADFKVKTCLHSIGYSGIWSGQEKLTIDEFLLTMTRKPGQNLRIELKIWD